MKYIIIGFGASGTAAAESIRQNDKEGDITIIGNEPYDFYSRILLSNVTSSLISKENIFLKKDIFYETNKIIRIKNQSVKSIDIKNKNVCLNNGISIPYGKLLIAAGASSIKLMQQENTEGIYNLYNLEDAIKVKDVFQNTKKAVVIGGGFIGTDWLKALNMKNIDTTLLVRNKAIFSRFLPEEGYRIIEKKLIEKGINILNNQEVEHFEFNNNKLIKVITNIKHEIECDFLGLGIGVTRNLDFLPKQQIQTNIGVLVDEYLRTNIEDIYASGDVTEYQDKYTMKFKVSSTWSNALNMGKIAGQNMTGLNNKFHILPSQIINLFDIGFSQVGYNLEDFEDVKESIEYTNDEFARYFLKNGKVIGAQFVGSKASYLLSGITNEINNNLENIFKSI